MDKSKYPEKLDTHIADIDADGVLQVDRKSVRQVRPILDRRRLSAKDGTCLPGKTNPGSYTNPGEIDTVYDDVFD
jgi:hypothetical protein